MMLDRILRDWAALAAPKPLVVLFDEVDVLEDQAMVSFLRQLRGGFAGRGIGKFPVSVALVGMRDLRDIRRSADSGSGRLTRRHRKSHQSVTAAKSDQAGTPKARSIAARAAS